MFVPEKTTSLDYNEASNTQLCESYKKITEDLLATVENIISGISSLSTNNVNNFIECRIQAAANHPIVILLYENGYEEGITDAFPDTTIVKMEHEGETESTKYPSCSKAFAPSQSVRENNTLEENTECRFKNEMLISFGRYCSFKDGIEINENSRELMGSNNGITNHADNEEIQLNQQNIFNNEPDTVHLHSCEPIPENEDDNCDKLSSLHIISRDSGLVENAGVILNKNNAVSKRTVSSDSTAVTKTTSTTITTNKNKSKQKRKRKNSKEKVLHGCDYCEKTFSSSSHKKTHERIHTGEKPYSCSYCNRKFSHIGNRRLHERTHTGEKPYECIYCKKTFANYSNKAVHERTHTGERPYKCDFCEKSFIRSDDKRIHQRIHTGEKPYRCDYCDKTFVRFSNKIDHEKHHIGKRAYKCDFCEKSFIRSGNKTTHERIHIGALRLQLLGENFFKSYQ